MSINKQTSKEFKALALKMSKLREDLAEAIASRDEWHALHDERLRLHRAERARAEMAESEVTGLRESLGQAHALHGIDRSRADASRAFAVAICAIDTALGEFASHHQREDGRQRTVLECVQEAMDGLHRRIASLEAERAKLRSALEDLDAALGDRLLAQGPLSKNYAHKVMTKIQEALEPSR